MLKGSAAPAHPLPPGFQLLGLAGGGGIFGGVGVKRKTLIWILAAIAVYLIFFRPGKARAAPKMTIPDPVPAPELPPPKGTVEVGETTVTYPDGDVVKIPGERFGGPV